MHINIRPDERVTLIGMTGSGKSTLAQYLLADEPRVVFVDPKSEMDSVAWNAREYDGNAYNQLLKGRPGRYILRAPIDQDYERYFEQFYTLGRLIVYIDEVYGVTAGRTRAGNWLTALYTRGRSRQIAVWAATQRPRWIPLFILSEANWLFLFRLQLEADREAVASIMGPKALISPPDQYGFWIKYYRWESPIYTKGIKALEGVAAK